MVELGYALSSEEHTPTDLVTYAARAEETGFTFALISDHFHPWIDRQGNSAFVWSVLGAIADRTERLKIGTGVTCPLIRMHPAIVAHAAATVAAMMPGRFFLGLGTGENLNEHVLGDRWPPPTVRREMLIEALDVIRALWGGSLTSHRGVHYTVENARLYTVPDEPPPIAIAAAGQMAATIAGECADALIGVAPDREIVETFERAGGAGKPRYGQVTVCWAADEATARATAMEWWPTSAIPGELGQELPLPKHFEQAAKNVREDDVAKVIACGPDPELHLEYIRRYIDAGYDHIYVHQVGPDQDGFFRFYADNILPKVA